MREIFADVRVFDGDRVLDGSYDVVIDAGTIAALEPAGAPAQQDARKDARILGGPGTMLLPGLIDAHVHLRGTGDLEELARWGVTTALDMGSWPASLIEELRRAGSTDVRSTGAGAVGPGSLQATIPGRPTH